MYRKDKQKGMFVTFEGPNGVGKSSLLNGVANRLTQLGFDVFRTKEPTLSSLGQFVRDAEENYQGRILACLVVADRYFHLENEVLPAVQEDKIVLSDRYIESSLVLQRLDGLDIEFIWMLNSQNMEIKDTSQTKKFSLFCWNIANPSLERVGRQIEWLRKRSENVLVLTETKCSKGCIFLERYFQTYGYNVVFPRPEEKEFGVMIVSKHSLTPSNFSDHVDYLQARVASAKLNLPSGELEIIGAYVPSRDSSHEKTDKKKHFLKSLTNALEAAPRSSRRIFCGDLNVLEPNHIPHYPFFEEWEYDFYRNLEKYRLKDVFRHLNPSTQEHSWVGRTGDGYRYDHCFVSDGLLPSITRCYYLHEPRETRLSDHSALITELNCRLMN